MAVLSSHLAAKALTVEIVQVILVRIGKVFDLVLHRGGRLFLLGRRGDRGHGIQGEPLDLVLHRGGRLFLLGRRGNRGLGIRCDLLDLVLGIQGDPLGLVRYRRGGNRVLGIRGDPLDLVLYLSHGLDKR